MSSLTIKDYFSTYGSRFSFADAKIIGPVLHELGAQPSPEKVLEAAQSSNCPLHRYFEWDDQRAAHKFRIGQAETMVREIRVRVVSNGRTEETKAVNVQATPHGRFNPAPRPYVAHISAADDVGHLARSALHELEEWQSKYGSHIQIFGAFAQSIQIILNQIDEFKEEVEEGHASGIFRKMLREFFEWHSEHMKPNCAARTYGDQMLYMSQAVTDATVQYAELFPTAPRFQEEDVG